jgi:acetyl esterase/lipase
VLREPGIGGVCPSCGELFGSEAVFCWRCGTQVQSTAAAAPPEIEKDIVYGKGGEQELKLDLARPTKGDGPLPAVVCLHGGGWRMGSRHAAGAAYRDADPTPFERMAQSGIAVANVDYRLSGEATWPAQLHDVKAAVRWVRDNARRLEVDPARIGALGESAGGTLAALLATMGDGWLEKDARIRVAIAWSGPMDLVSLTAERGDGWAVPLMGCTLDACRDRFQQASPVTHVDRSDAPLLLLTSDDELVPITQAAAMEDRLRKAGVPYDATVYRGTRHALDYRDEAIGVTVSWLERHLADNGKSPAGTAAFLVTVVVVVAGGAALVLRWRRRHAGAAIS